MQEAENQFFKNVLLKVMLIAQLYNATQLKYICIYVYVYMCVCVCVHVLGSVLKLYDRKRLESKSVNVFTWIFFKKWEHGTILLFAFIMYFSTCLG